MLVLIILIFSLILSLSTGGRLKYAQNWQLKKVWLALGVFALQTTLFTQWGSSLVGETLAPIIYLFTLLTLFFFLLLNRRVLGVPILLVGLILNLLVIGANAGRMPASVEVLIRAGRIEEATLLKTLGKAANCVLMSDSTKFNILGDIIPIRLGGPIGSAYSVGDLFTLVGEAVMIFGVFRKKSEDNIYKKT